MEQIRKQEGAFNQFLTYMSTVGATSAVTKTLTAPLERVKLIFQAQDMLTIYHRYKFNSYAQYFSRIPREQGFQSFFRGNFANIINIIPQAGIQFIFYDNLQRIFCPQEDEQLGMARYFVSKMMCALSCGMVTLMFTYPLDTVRVRLSLEFSKNKEHRKFRGVFQTLGETRSTQGFSQLYRGFLLANATNIHYFIAMHTVIEVLKKMDSLQLQQSNNNSNNSDVQQSQSDVNKLLQYVGVSQIGAFVAMVAVYPLDTIRRRLQMNGYNGRAGQYSGTLDCFNQIKSQQGLKTLYNGIGASCVKFGIASVAQVAILNQIIQFKSNNNASSIIGGDSSTTH